MFLGCQVDWWPCFLWKFVFFARLIESIEQNCACITTPTSVKCKGKVQSGAAPVSSSRTDIEFVKSSSLLNFLYSVIVFFADSTAVFLQWNSPFAAVFQFSSTPISLHIILVRRFVFSTLNAECCISCSFLICNENFVFACGQIHSVFFNQRNKKANVSTTNGAHFECQI